jgi:hypothetical protein
MAQPTDRETLKDYCLRRLGHPVIEINIDDDQLEDRIDDAFQFYREFHYDAIEKVYLQHQVTANNIADRYITLSDAITGVERVLPFSSRTTSQMNIFDVRYQILINDLYSLVSTDLIYYYQVKGQLQLIQDLLVGTKPVRFNRHMNRLYVDWDWTADIAVGDYFIVECWRILDPATYTDVYNDMWLKRYATALIKRQWGDNLKKFEGIQMPGGVTLNGQKIFDEALAEIAQIEDEIRKTFELPVDFFVG